LLHALFHREHNAICAELKWAYPDRDDEWLFQKARMVNATWRGEDRCMIGFS